MTTKRPSLKERAFEKLGFGQRFRSNTDPDDDHSKTSWYTPSMDGDHETHMDVTRADNPGTSNSETVAGSLYGETPQVSMTSQPPPDKKPKKVKPEGADEYTVKDKDSIESIAAFFDTTPSELKKLNRLTSRLIFSGQTLYVPKPQDLMEEVKMELSSPRKLDVKDLMEHRPCMDIPLVRMADKPPAKIPGHIERQTSTTSPGHDENESPHKLSEDEAKQLDQECFERFIKVAVKHITDGQGVVSGVLLVTPNAVMFDPNVSDPLVLEHGAERYGVIAPMDMIVSAAMYHDIAAMNIHGEKGKTRSDIPKPEIYHDKSCPMYKAWVEGHAELMKRDPPTNVATTTNAPSRSTTINSEMSEAGSLCSCGQGTGLDTTSQTGRGLSPGGQSGAGLSPVNQRLSPNKDDDVMLLNLDIKDDVRACNSDVSPRQPTLDNLVPDNQSTQQQRGSVRSSSMDEFGDFQSAELTFQGGRTTESTAADDKMLSLQDKSTTDKSTTDTDNLFLNQSLATVETNEPSGISDVVKYSNSSPSACRNHDNKDGGQDKDNQESTTGSDTSRTSKTFHLENTVAVQRVLSTQSASNSENGGTVDNNSTMEQIGNIVYLPMSEDQQGGITMSDVETAQDRLSKISVDQFEQRDRSSTDPIDVPDSKMSTAEARLSSGSSFGSFTVSPHLSAFVNYATGLFKTNADIKDISEVIPGEENQEDVALMSTESEKIIPRFSGKSGLEVENAIKLTDKPELFQSFDDLIPKPAATFEDLPLYLCLRLGMPINREISQTCPIQAYGKGRKKPEYWFSIPRDKVDHLYAFFVQWTPQIYGGEDDIAEKRGFIVLNDEEEEEDEKIEMMDEYFSNGMLQKDWEIISADEMMNRKKSVAEIEILPEIIGESKILEEKHIYMVNRVLPPRTIGYPWTMIYSTEQHGFSLRTLYRGMQGIDSPILLIVHDTSGNIFGAVTSCALKMSDHFYGTGESFLFTFYPEFKVFHWTGDNDFFLKGNSESLFIGAGQGNFGLWFDGDIYHGRTQHCETYDNDILTGSEDFVVKTLEAWAFCDD